MESVLNNPPPFEHMCIVCNRNTAGTPRLRLRTKQGAGKGKGIRWIASIHFECAFGLPWNNPDHRIVSEE